MCAVALTIASASMYAGHDVNVGPDALKWSWLLLVFGALLFADGFFNWGMFTSERKRLGERSIRYGAFGRWSRMIFGAWIAAAGGLGLGYLAML
jgi:hypothetical protein